MPLFTFNKKIILFIHIPKTGGSSIEKWLRNYTEISFFQPIVAPFMKVSPQHLTIHDFFFLFQKKMCNRAFSIVRNPYDKLESEFYFRTDKQFEINNFRVDFSTWLIHNLKLYKKNNFHNDNHLRPQTDFLNEQVQIFKFENGISNIAEKIKEWFEIENLVDFPHILKAKNKTEIVWSNEAIRMVNNIYKLDFETFEYPLKKIKLSQK